MKISTLLLLVASCGGTLGSAAPAPDAAPEVAAPLPRCTVTPNDLLHGLGIGACGDGRSVCRGEFTPPDTGCVLWQGQPIETICVPSC